MNLLFYALFTAMNLDHHPDQEAVGTADEYESVLFVHKHCISCFRPYSFACKTGCIIIHCSYCGFFMHDCKLVDHLEICPEYTVPCINKWHGCSMKLKRKHLATHLKQCPASAVQCKSKWKRQFVNLFARKLWKNTDSVKMMKIDRNIPPDLAFAISDQNKIIALKQYPRLMWKRFKHYEQVFSRSFDTHYPLLPFKPTDREVYEFCSGTSCDVFDEDSSNDEATFYAADNVVKHAFIFKRPIEWHEYYRTCSDCNWILGIPPCCPLHLARMSLRIPAKFYPTRKYDRIPTFYNNLGMLVKLQSYVICERDKLKFKEELSYGCLQSMRRDEYENHIYHIHDRLLPNLHEIIQRCPGYLNGCMFYVIAEPRSDLLLRLNPTTDSFTVTYSDIASEIHQEKVKRNHVLLLNLPNELLTIICTKLDGASLYCLSLACRRLRSVTQSQLKLKGYLESQWMRVIRPDGRFGWDRSRIVSNMCLFI